MHLVLCYYNFRRFSNVSHIGLGVSALNNSKVLNKHGLKTTVYSVASKDDINQILENDASITHLVIAAPWMETNDLAELVFKWPHTVFAVNCHSNVAFLQADRNGIKKLREYIDVDQGSNNFTVAANCAACVRWIRKAYQTTCTYLPNMYYLDYSAVPNRPVWNGGTLRIGAFGATRPQKNLIMAAAAALNLHQELKSDTEIWINGGRTEGGGSSIISAMQEMIANVPGIQLKILNWASWPQFRDVVRRMHLNIIPSITESFCLTAADSIAEGVPVVATEAIDWLPSYMQAEFDDANDMARVGAQLLTYPNAAKEGLIALEQHNSSSFTAWTKFLEQPKIYQPIFQDPFLL